ncbi:MAG TPA: hypothetical protein VHB21_25020 [Minicystis sp.]|nr:hypothetical protein [Minicystis sp.]
MEVLLMRALVLVPLSFTVLAACSPDVVDIHAEATGSGTGGTQQVTSHAVGTGGFGGHSMGAGAGGASAVSVSSSSTGTGGSGGSVLTKVLTADTDVNQLATITVNAVNVSATQVLEGPFVITDVVSQYGYPLVSTPNGSCGAVSPQDPTLALPIAPAGALPQVHGVRGFVPAGSILCFMGSPGFVTVSGFRPY